MGSGLALLPPSFGSLTVLIKNIFLPADQHRQTDVRVHYSLGHSCLKRAHVSPMYAFHPLVSSNCILDKNDESGYVNLSNSTKMSWLNITGNPRTS